MKGKQRDLSKDLDCTWEHRYFPGAPQCPYPYKDKIDNRTEQRPKKKKFWKESQCTCSNLQSRVT